MTQEENDIMRDMYFFLRDHTLPLTNDLNALLLFWQNTAADIENLVGVKWRNHSLAMEIGIALYSYLEKKAKAGANA